MNSRFLQILPLLLSLLAVSTAGAKEILLTAFGPFGAEPVNNSTLVMKRLAKRLSKFSLAAASRVNVKQCILPAEYDRGAKVAFECGARNTYDLVLSLGARDCSLDFETRARNRDDFDLSDAAGVIRDRATPIVAGAPEWIAFNAPMDLLYSRAPRFGDFAVQRSSDAGAYVCNHAAYLLAQWYTRPGSTTKYGFIHVPPVSCGSSTADPDKLAETIAQALRASMPELF